MSDTAARLLRLLPLLGQRHLWRGQDLAARLGVTSRTLRRDVERLRRLGYTVDAVPGPAGGYRLSAGAGLPPIALDDDAAVAVAVGLRLAAAGALPGSEEAAARALLAIEQVMPSRLRHRAMALRASTESLTGGAPAIDPTALARMALACQDGERLRFGYVDHDGTASVRHVEPHRLVSSGRRWYLVARDLDRQAWRSFRLDRLTDAQATGRRSRPADPPDATRFVSRGVASGGYPWQARVRLDAPAAEVSRKVPPTVGTVECLGSNSSLLVTGVHSLDALAVHLACLDVPFTVLEPAALAERCAVLAGRLGAAASTASATAASTGASTAASASTASTASTANTASTGSTANTGSTGSTASAGAAAGATTGPGRAAPVPS